MFLDKKLIDCSVIVDDHPTLLGLPTQKRIWSDTSIAFPESPDTEVEERINLQKSIIQNFGVIEILFALTDAASDCPEYFKRVVKLALPNPAWHDPANCRPVGSSFILNGINFQVEQHSCNFRSQLLLTKNNELIFAAYIGATSPAQIGISSSKLNENDVRHLAVVAKVIEGKRKVNHDAFFNEMITRLKNENDDNIKGNF
jgi:hypothetical protein